MDEYAEAKKLAEMIVKNRQSYLNDTVHLAESFLTLYSFIRPCEPDKMLKRLHLIRNHNLEEAAKQIEKLSGRKRGEINRESAEYVRKLKKY